ncbi:MAG: RHS repeat-associated core domain-containing protein [Myxococcota bacterium]|nr:RHS repeat-associated core domain-containing protein [Myxococcota bacterium]
MVALPANSENPGSVRVRGEYFPYGKASDRRDERNRYRYIGVERDKLTALSMTGPRAYDTVTGRFLQGDPILFEVDHYGVRAAFGYPTNPLRQLDSSGWEPEDSPGALAKLEQDAKELDTDTLRSLAIEHGWVGRIRRRNVKQQAGYLAEAIVGESTDHARFLERFYGPLPTPNRGSRWGVHSVRPDFWRSTIVARGTIDIKWVGFIPVPVPGDDFESKIYEYGILVEVKARGSGMADSEHVVTMAADSGQAAGYLEYITDHPEETGFQDSMGLAHASIIYITTSDVSISPALVQEFNEAGVAVYHAKLEYAEYGGDTYVRVGRAELLESDAPLSLNPEFETGLATEAGDWVLVPGG